MNNITQEERKMKTKLTVKESVVLASMLFGLFFGAGNLIFPVYMGQQAGANLWPAAIGFCLTGVGLPLLGIASMGISGSEGLFDMSKKAGRGFGYFFTCALYLCIGPLFAIPRTATVSFQVGVLPLLTEESSTLALFIFALLFFAVVLFFSLRPSGILTWVGKILNPLFLVFLGILIFRALISPMGTIADLPPAGAYVDNSFFTGFLEGYNTMDALASLAFGIILINVIRNLGIRDPKKISQSTIKSGFFSIAVMALIYCALAVVGAQSRAVYGFGTDGGSILHAIATHYFGRLGGIFLGITITFACLKTAIGLVTSCSTTFAELFPKTLSYRGYTVIFSAFSFCISNVGLSRMIQYSLPALYFLYPLTIVLILLCLCGKLFAYRQCVFVATLAATGLAAFLDLLNALPHSLQEKFPFYTPLHSLSQYFPFASLGMGWIVPALVGLALGILILLCGKKKKPSTAL